MPKLSLIQSTQIKQTTRSLAMLSSDAATS
ncbi:hypothetical protein LINPERPRIM_LOCUS38604 [Linum perenne]